MKYIIDEAVLKYILAKTKFVDISFGEMQELIATINKLPEYKEETNKKEDVTDKKEK